MNSEKPKRRQRYRGKNPRHFSEKYKERAPERYAEDVARIIDRGRTLTEKPQVIATYDQAGLQKELELLEQRRRITSRSITSCTVAALLVCLVIVALFLEVLFSIPLNWFIGALFILSTLALVIGLGYFLKEVHLSSNTVRIRVSGVRMGKH